MIYANGMNPGAEVGNVLRVIQGTGRGQLRKITGNTQTQLSWDLPLLLDTTSVWIVEAPAWDYSADSTAINNADLSHAVTLNVPTDNFVDTPLLIAGFTVDSNGNECPDGDVPIREDWIYGAEGQGSGFMLPVAGVLGIQSDAAPAFYLNGDMTPGAIKAYVKSAPVGADLTFSLYIGTSSTPYISLTIANGSKSVVATSDRRPCANSNRSSPVRRRASSIWPPADGRMVSSVRAAEIAGLMNWSNSDGGSALVAATRFR
jgi:hypothetical protein